MTASYSLAVCSSGSNTSKVLRHNDITKNCTGLLDRHMWHSPTSLETKVHLYRTYIRPILLYGCETWSSMTVQLSSQLDASVTGIQVEVIFIDKSLAATGLLHYQFTAPDIFWRTVAVYWKWPQYRDVWATSSRVETSVIDQQTLGFENWGRLSNHSTTRAYYYFPPGSSNLPSCTATLPFSQYQMSAW